VIDTVLPAEVAASEVFQDLSDVLLFPEELGLTETMVPKRRAEFATGRACARTALLMLKQASVAIPAGASNEPQWPTDVVGSITHCVGYRAAAVADARKIATIGIDAEPHERLPEGIVTTIARAEELWHLRQLRMGTPSIHWDRMLFSAKEAVFKAWFPHAKRWLGFHDATLRIDPRDGTFVARLTGPALRLGDKWLDTFSGRWCVARGLIVTTVTVRAIGAPRVEPVAPPAARASRTSVGSRPTDLGAPVPEYEMADIANVDAAR
jgi:4'-phosphopantetheinyl transferase EntD